MVPGLDVPQLVELLRIHRGEFSIDFEVALLFFHFYYFLALFGNLVKGLARELDIAKLKPISLFISSF